MSKYLSKPVVYRLARFSEAKSIAAMSRDFIENGLGWSWTAERILAGIRSKDTNVVVAVMDDVLLGFGIMEYRREEACLNLLATMPQYRRQGLGKQLVRWLEKSAITAGITVAYLQCRAGCMDVQKFYEKLGYKKLKTLPGYYRGVESAVLMGRDLMYPHTLVDS
jgi:ribosomal-protein-alanine N-acetyltransferase